MHCRYHTRKQTRRRCSICGKPICTRCRTVYDGLVLCKGRCLHIYRFKRLLSFIVHTLQRMVSNPSAFLLAPFRGVLVYGYGIFLSVASVSFLYIYMNIHDTKMVQTVDEPFYIHYETITPFIERENIHFYRKVRMDRYDFKMDEPLDEAMIEDDLPETTSPLEPARPDQSLPLTMPDITRGDISRMELAITFDGGYDGSDAERILGVLRERNIRTTFFLTGRFIKRYPHIVKRMVEEGHEVGNHTMNHPHLTDFATTRRHTTLPWVNREFVLRELREAEKAFEEITGRKMAPFWRAPYGEINDEIRKWAFDAGYIHVGWTYNYRNGESLDSLDWVHDRTSQLYLSADEIIRKILDFDSDGYGLRGGIILMHLGTRREDDKVSEKLDQLLDELKARGYKPVKISDLVRGLEFDMDGAHLLASREGGG